jgi:pimeloyl-ACP methyl ester carboxylesterase
METVVLLSGLWLPGWSLFLLKRRLRACGYQVRIYNYRSVRATLAENAAGLQAFLQSLTADTVHLVGYSLGGIVIRALFHSFPGQRPGRIVTLATPHLGSCVAMRMTRSTWGRRLLGRSVQDLASGVPQAWVIPPREIGTLAGSMPIGLGMCCTRLSGPHDGTVAVAETLLSGHADSVAVRVAHFSILMSPVVARQTCHFLATGRFSH